MKTTNRIKTLLIGTALLLGGRAFSFLGNTIKGNEATACLEITGKIVAGKTKDTPFMVYLFCYNTKLDSTKVIGGKPFKFRLAKNQQYSIQMAGEGFVSRLLSISTHLPGSVSISPIFRFHFETELVEKTAVGTLNADALDFPIALISFDPQKAVFDYNRKYTTRIKKEIGLQSAKK